MATILVLEDDKDLNKSLCTFLAMKNHETDGFTNAEAALEGMENKKYDLIISDVMMKDMDGFEFAEAIRDMDDSIPIMFMTALDDIYSKTKGYKNRYRRLHGEACGSGGIELKDRCFIKKIGA